MRLICVFVFAYEKSRFSHDAAQIITDRSMAVVMLWFSMLFLICVGFGADFTFLQVDKFYYGIGS